MGGRHPGHFTVKSSLRGTEEEERREDTFFSRLELPLQHTRKANTMHSGGKWKLNYIFLSSLKNNLPKLNCVRNASHSYGRPLSNMARPPKLPAFSMINLVDGHGHRCDCNVQQSRRMSFSLSSFPWSNRKNGKSNGRYLIVNWEGGRGVVASRIGAGNFENKGAH